MSSLQYIRQNCLHYPFLIFDYRLSFLLTDQRRCLIEAAATFLSNNGAALLRHTCRYFRSSLPSAACTIFPGCKHAVSKKICCIQSSLLAFLAVVQPRKGRDLDLREIPQRLRFLIVHASLGQLIVLVINFVLQASLDEVS